MVLHARSVCHPVETARRCRRCRAHGFRIVHAVCSVVHLMQTIVQMLLLLPITATVRERLGAAALWIGCAVAVVLSIYEFAFGG